ncbi:serine/threonine protein kinase [Lysinibacillus halotolerans]|uniref:non-specific serine/threonine protein kinase n=2 Tax=Lysinibacillus halotolerans TaxID=1368476 RepID=A0A3M8HBR4_9BACI|nr:serine/threonine protein kinase [Lysinibacillus halotolerans]
MASMNRIIDNKYEILRMIGQGGMSKVYLAMDSRLNKQWAIKEISRINKNGFSEVNLKAALDEADMMKRLDHPALPRIVDIIQEKDVIYVVMDYIEGEPLSKLLENGNAQPQEQVIEWAKQLCNVLDYLHTCNPPIIYRDMKPGNIMLKPDGQLKLIDFGIAREYKENKVGDTVNLGTRGYAAPEQFGSHGQTDARTDIYCLGMTLYHLVTGRSPAEEPYGGVPIRELNPILSSGLEKIILKCTEANPNDRYQSCAELLYDLERYDEVDDTYRQNQKKKLKRFGIVSAAAVFSIVFGAFAQVMNAQKVNNDYEVNLDLGDTATTQEQKINYYEKAIDIKPEKHEAYYALLTTFKDDASFQIEEEQILKKKINRNLAELVETDHYSDLAYEIGKTYWYYYDYGSENTDDNQLTRIKAAKTWFSDVVEDPENEHYAQAKIYESIATFHEEVNLKVEEASDQGMYKEYWDNIEALLDFTIENKNESEIVKLEVYKLITNALENEVRKFASDGIEKDDLLEVFYTVRSLVDELDVSTDKTINLKESITSRFDEVVKAIDTAFIEQ